MKRLPVVLLAAASLFLIAVIALAYWMPVAPPPANVEAEPVTPAAAAPSSAAPVTPAPVVEAPAASALDAGPSAAEIQAYVDAEMAKVRADVYVPSSELPPQRTPQEPIGGESHLADREAFIRRAKDALGADLELRCELTPCWLRGDFDGDGKTDAAVGASPKGKYQPELLVFLGSQPAPLKLAAMTGIDPLGATGWSFEDGAIKLAMLEGNKQGNTAIIQLTREGEASVSWQ
jgi:hypothetical protein